MVIIEGKQETANSSRSFYKKFTIPQGVKPEDITSNLNPKGVLTISAPIHSSTQNQQLIQQEQETNTSSRSVVAKQESVTSQTSVRKIQQQSVHQQSSIDSTTSASSIMDDFIIRPIMGIDSMLEKDSRFEDVSKQVCKVDNDKKFEVRRISKLKL